MGPMVLKKVKIWKAFFSNSLTRDMEYKSNLIGSIFVDIIYYGIHYLFFSIIYSYVDALGVFTKEDVIIFLIITFLSDSVYMFLFSSNLHGLNGLIVRGDLDFMLLKPINAQFLISLRYVRSYAILSIIILIFLLIKLTNDFYGGILFFNWILFIISFISGITIWYTLDFSISCMTFWFRQFSMGGWLSNELLKFSRRPDSIYGGIIRKVLFTAVPMILISSIPARMLIYSPNLKIFFIQIFITILFFILTPILWRNGLIKYESASS